MRKLASFALSFSVAVLLAAYLLPPEPLLLMAACLCALLALAGLFLWKAERRLRAVLVAFGACLGLLWFTCYSVWFYTPAQRLIGQTLEISATVTGWPEESSFGVTVPAAIHMQAGPGLKVRLYAPKEHQSLKPGDEMIATVKLRASDDELPGRNMALGVYLSGTVQGKPEVYPVKEIPLRYLPVLIERTIQESIARCFPPDTAPLMTALLTGGKSELPGELESALRRVGLSHVIVVSGLHISFLAGLATTLLGRNRWRSSILGIALLFGFAAVVGNTPSVLRAAFVQSFLLLAPLFGREDDKPTSLSAILMLLLLVNPFSAASVSLQLSFAAVAGIYLISGPLYELWTQNLSGQGCGILVRIARGAARFALGTLATTLGALLLTTPLTTFYFGYLCLISPLSNLLALWPVSVAFTCGLIAVLAELLFPPLGWLLGAAASVPLRYLTGIAMALSRLPFASVPLDSVYLWLWLMLAYAVLILYLLWPIQKKRPLFPVCLCITVLCTLLLLRTGEAQGRLTISVLDVGQGQSIVLRSGGKTAMVDCGGNGGADPGNVAADFIQGFGNNHLDVLILTHYHSDHACGVPQLLARLTVGVILMPDVEPEDPSRIEIAALAEQKGIPVQLVAEDAGIVLGEALLAIYAPLGGGGGNEEGLSVLCTAGTFDALMTGDMNATIERRLVKYGGLPDIELLVAGHHGSKYATSDELLAATTPELCVISVGENSYGHPAYETMERLDQAGCKIFRTDLMGTLKITAN